MFLFILRTRQITHGLPSVSSVSVLTTSLSLIFVKTVYGKQKFLAAVFAPCVSFVDAIVLLSCQSDCIHTFVNICCSVLLHIKYRFLWRRWWWWVYFVEKSTAATTFRRENVAWNAKLFGLQRTNLLPGMKVRVVRIPCDPDPGREYRQYRIADSVSGFRGNSVALWTANGTRSSLRDRSPFRKSTRCDLRI